MRSNSRDIISLSLQLGCEGNGIPSATWISHKCIWPLWLCHMAETQGPPWARMCVDMERPLAFRCILSRGWQCYQRASGTRAQLPMREVSTQRGEHITIPRLGPQLVHTLGNARWDAWNERCLNECLSTMVLWFASKKVCKAHQELGLLLGSFSDADQKEGGQQLLLVV